MKRLIVAITGASGSIYGIRALEILRDLDGIETHVVVTKGARATLTQETGLSVARVLELADEVHANTNLGASIASGSFRVDGMLVAPCSVKSLAGIAACYSDNLVTRAADVTLKERRRLVLLVRETPLHRGHIRLFDQVTAAGAIVMPPVPAFYIRPDTMADIVDHTVVRALDLFGIDSAGSTRWQGIFASTGDVASRSGASPVHSGDELHA
ncbi:UbiX family flavin prenyltransferase [Nocardia gipuzkoensis]|uniref:UbiX family flavin prenyltransferase n=1 Tax=Nocardia gipuzkoensis TaxID=2749991 RepID=UPI00237DCCC9|nr:UbiX family flavin prenyltransferase [Nocardia gipuzkoensis]MDE1674872.1 UbiX family flavin prenyltransferase [Nocardia gipuzkoensis]